MKFDKHHTTKLLDILFSIFQIYFLLKLIHLTLIIFLVLYYNMFSMFSAFIPYFTINLLLSQRNRLRVSFIFLSFFILLFYILLYHLYVLLSFLLHLYPCLYFANFLSAKNYILLCSHITSLFLTLLHIISDVYLYVQFYRLYFYHKTHTRSPFVSLNLHVYIFLPTYAHDITICINYP